METKSLFSLLEDVANGYKLRGMALPKGLQEFGEGEAKWHLRQLSLLDTNGQPATAHLAVPAPVQASAPLAVVSSDIPVPVLTKRFVATLRKLHAMLDPQQQGGIQAMPCRAEIARVIGVLTNG